MSKRPTAYELGQEYAKLEKAYAEASTALTTATDLMLACLSASGPTADAMYVATGRRAIELSNKTTEIRKELDTIKKQARKWYGIAL